MKILLLDVETAPNLATVWGIWNQNIGINQLLETSRIMCYSAKWLGERPILFDSEFKSTHKDMIIGLHTLLDEADAIIHYNGKRFDIPVINREFLMYEMNPPSPYKQIDLYQTVKKEFRFVSNKLDHVAQELGIGSKVKHEGMNLWLDCMNRVPAAWKRMEKYNKQDVNLLIKLYDHLLPWIKNHPNYALYVDTNRPTCTNCGGTHVHSRGLAHTKTQSYQRYQCADCGTWIRGRTTALAKEKKKDILVQVV